VLHRELAVGDLPADVQLRAVRHGDLVVVPQQGHRFPADGGELLPVALDHHRAADGDHLLVEGEQHLVRTAVLQLEGVPQSHGLAVDQVDLVAVLVLDPVVVAHGDQAFAHHESHGYGVPRRTPGDAAGRPNGVMTDAPTGLVRPRGTLEG
jgi:hypothetical protein